MTDRFVDTGNFISDDVDLVGLEAALVSGPLSFQGEYMFANVDIASSADFHSYYAQLSYFLTGEHRRYKTSSGTFSRIKPKENYSYKGGGRGAWELAFRYSGLDINDSGILGGHLHDITAALNWYLNPNTRVMWNYINSKTEGIGIAHIFLTRLQVDF
jgi:phosphate-selective porin OprO/OprP